MLVSLLFCTAAFAQQGFQVLEITPGAGPTTGGTVVKIRMNSLPDCPILPIGPPTVSFGDRWVNAQMSGDDLLIVVAPEHPAGKVDLTIQGCGMDDLVVEDGFTYFQQGGSSAPFKVESITPASGPTTGGTEVTVKINDIPFCFDPVPGAMLYFGGVAATNVREDQDANTITAVTPAHSAGTVDVRVQTCGGPSVTVQSVFTYNSAADPNPAYEKVLFPVLFYGPGAYDAQWTTTASVYNAGDFEVTTANPVFTGDPSCPSVCGCAPSATVGAEGYAAICSSFADPAGMIFYAPKIASEDLHYHLRVSDTSRSGKNAGTEIPVVREREFRTDAIVLQNLPLDEKFRLALRVYNPDQLNGMQVRMQIMEANGVGQHGERILTLSYPIQTTQPDPWPNRPAFVYVGDLEAIVRTMLNQTPILAPPQLEDDISRFHVRLTPVTPGARFWAIASITNNDTQLITTVSPQY